MLIFVDRKKIFYTPFTQAKLYGSKRHAILGYDTGPISCLHAGTDMGLTSRLHVGTDMGLISRLHAGTDMGLISRLRGNGSKLL